MAEGVRRPPDGTGPAPPLLSREEKSRILDNGAEFTAKAVREWLQRVQVHTLFITPGSPWENGYIESFNGKLRDELLDREIFYTLGEAKILIERWRQEYNTFRPHSALGYRPPVPETVMWPPPTVFQPATAVGPT